MFFSFGLLCAPPPPPPPPTPFPPACPPPPPSGVCVNLNGFCACVRTANAFWCKEIQKWQVKQSKGGETVDLRARPATLTSILQEFAVSFGGLQTRFRSEELEIGHCHRELELASPLGPRRSMAAASEEHKAATCSSDTGQMSRSGSSLPPCLLTFNTRTPAVTERH